MRFSDQFKIKRSRSETWFDSVLSVDTLLFIDPFLIYSQEKGVFKGSHREIISFFNRIFKLIAQSRGNKSSLLYQKAAMALVFPERQELCLGYTEAGTRGSGSGKELAGVVASAIWEAIQAGLVEIRHFEEIAILREGIGADRISDITAGLLLARLAKYTESICRRHRIPTRIFRYDHGTYDVKKDHWRPVSLRLPINPHSQKPILLVPESYLKPLPTINPTDFWDYCYSNENEIIRNEFSYDVVRHVSKKDIVQLAKRHPEFIKKYINHEEKCRPRPYNLKRDEKGLVRWYDASKQYVAKHPVMGTISTRDEFIGLVSRFIGEFRHFVEENGGWRLLWNENQTSRSENAAQLLFLGIVKHYCQANNIDVSPEPNIGRGPVDFKMSRGYEHRTLLELKLAHNTKFWRGLRKQLPTYLNAEKIHHGFFVVIVYSDSDMKRIANIRRAVRESARKPNCEITVLVIDARGNKPSASKL